MEAAGDFVLQDYGLSDLSALTDGQDDDALNDDTFGTDGQAGWDWGSEETLELARLHEEFLQGQSSQGGFFGDALEDNANDFMLESVPTEDTVLESGLIGGLEEAAGPALSSNRGLRVSGLPAHLDEAEVKQLLSHFGALSRFSMQREATSAVAELMYEDSSITETACVNLNGIPMGSGQAPSLPAPPRQPNEVPRRGDAHLSQLAMLRCTIYYCTAPVFIEASHCIPPHNLHSFMSILCSAPTRKLTRCVPTPRSTLLVQLIELSPAEPSPLAVSPPTLSAALPFSSVPPAASANGALEAARSAGAVDVAALEARFSQASCGEIPSAVLAPSAEQVVVPPIQQLPSAFPTLQSLEMGGLPVRSAPTGAPSQQQPLEPPHARMAQPTAALPIDQPPRPPLPSHGQMPMPPQQLQQLQQLQLQQRQQLQQQQQLQQLQQLHKLQQQSMALPPQMQNAFQQLSHLPLAQRQVVFQQMMAHQQRVNQHMMAMQHRGAPTLSSFRFTSHPTHHPAHPPTTHTYIWCAPSTQPHAPSHCRRWRQHIAARSSPRAKTSHRTRCWQVVHIPKAHPIRRHPPSRRQ